MGSFGLPGTIRKGKAVMLSQERILSKILSYITYTGMCRPSGVVILKLLI